jgi:hypothetical protein
MMQFNATANGEDDARIDSVAITGFGTGNDHEDIKVVYLIYDVRGDGEYDKEDAIIGYGNYMRDDGPIFLAIDPGFIVEAERMKSFLIAYNMETTGSVDETYRFDLITIESYGKNTGRYVTINGLPLGSAIKTISVAHTDAPTTTTTTTTTVPVDECETDTDCGGVSCTDLERTSNRCVLNDDTGTRRCVQTKVGVVCCTDQDCVGDYYCLDYDCVEEQKGGIGNILGGGGGAEGGGTNRILWTVGSIVLVIIAVVAIFFFVKNKKRKPVQESGSSDDEWSLLKKKWDENK